VEEGKEKAIELTGDLINAGLDLDYCSTED
jgi:hypothetical protein